MLERPPQQPAADGGNALRRSQRLGGHPGAQEEPPLLAKRVDLAGIHLEQIERLLGGRQEDGLQGPRHLFGNQPRGLKLRREIYEQGDSRDVALSIEKFLGRKQSIQPFLKKLGIEAQEKKGMPADPSQ